MNCVETGTLLPPKDLSTMYGWASNCKKAHNVRDRTMQVAVFVTKEETKDKQGPMTPNLLTLMKPEKDMSTVKCFRCKKKGHLVNKCPQKASLFHPSALQGVQESETTIRVNGIGGYQMTVSKKVRLPGFLMCIVMKGSR
jgi:hypothetical protein